MQQLVEDVIRLADARGRDAADDDEAEDVAVGATESERALYQALVELPLASLQRLQTLMYFGRGDADDLLWLHHDLHGEAEGGAREAAQIAYSMVEKAPLAWYLRAGVERARAAGIDLVAWHAGTLTFEPAVEVPRPPYTGPIFRITRPANGVDPIAEGPQIFHELAGEWPGDTIPAAQAGTFFEQLKARTGGLVIVDFIDMGNWDRMVGHELDATTGWLTLYWHDQRALPASSDERLLLPADVYGLITHLDHIRIVRGDGIAFFLLRSYATTPNQLKKRLRSGAEELHVEKESLFSTRVGRRAGGQTYVFDVQSASLYTIALVPKGRHVSSAFSRGLLFLANLRVLRRRLEAVIAALDAAEPLDDDIVCEKANTARRIVEQALKIDAVFRDVPFNDPYGQLLLGDLMGGLRPHYPEEMRSIFSKIAAWANELSHDSGLPVDRRRAGAMSKVILLYIALLEEETTGRVRA